MFRSQPNISLAISVDPRMMVKDIESEHIVIVPRIMADSYQGAESLGVLDVVKDITDKKKGR